MNYNPTSEDKLQEIKIGLNKEDSLICIKKSDAQDFEQKSKRDGKGTIQIMTYGNYIVYLRAKGPTFPNIPLSKFNYTSGTFEKKWGTDHRTIVLTPNHSSIRKIEIQIQGINIRKMKLLTDRTGDVLEDRAKVKITRHYRFHKGDSENRKDSTVASPGLKKAK